MDFKKMAEQNDTTSIVLKAKFLDLICEINHWKHSTIFESVYSGSNRFIASFGSASIENHYFEQTRLSIIVLRELEFYLAKVYSKLL